MIVASRFGRARRRTRQHVATLVSTLLAFGACKSFDQKVEGHGGTGGTGAAEGGDGGESDAGTGATGTAGDASGGDGKGASPSGGDSGSGASASGGRAGRGGDSGDAGTFQGGAAGEMEAGQGGVGADSTGGAAGSGGASSGDGGGTGGTSGAGAGNGGAGSGGTAGSGGSGTEGICRDDQTIVVECFTNGGFSLLSVPKAEGIGINSIPFWGGGFQLFGTKADSNMVAVSWTGDSVGSWWQPWLCFDAVPIPKRVAATSLRNGWPEVFVSTGCGTLFRRLSYNDGIWSSWMPFGLPSPQSFVTDVALSLASDGANHVYVADRGNVFVRRRLDADPYGPFSGWQSLGSPGAEVVAAGLRSDGRQQVFAVDQAGRASTSSQSSAELGSSFAEWVELSSSIVSEVVDIDVPYGTEFLEVYGVDPSGNLWSRREDGSDGLTEWTPWQGPATPFPLVGVASAALPPIEPAGPRLVLAVLTRGGIAYLIQRDFDQWAPNWTRIQ